jgi:hypothetical protein
MPPGLNLDSGLLNASLNTPPGRSAITEYGQFWVVPDDTKVCYVNIPGEQLTETEFASLESTWNAIKGGTGKLSITEADKTGTDHPGFKMMVQGQLAKLMSKPVGRRLLATIVNGSQQVTIRPSDSQIYGGANAIRGGAGTLENTDGTAGTGGTTIIQIDANLTDSDAVVFDSAGNEISLPVFITLGHELIHAKHNAEGRNRRNLAATNSDYSNREEEETIATGDMTENDLRTEHGLTLRNGHGGRDTR